MKKVVWYDVMVRNFSICTKRVLPPDVADLFEDLQEALERGQVRNRQRLGCLQTFRVHGFSVIASFHANADYWTDDMLTADLWEALPADVGELSVVHNAFITFRPKKETTN